MTGMGQVYEVPEDPDLILHGVGDIEASVSALTLAILGE